MMEYTQETKEAVMAILNGEQHEYEYQSKIDSNWDLCEMFHPLVYVTEGYKIRIKPATIDAGEVLNGVMIPKCEIDIYSGISDPVAHGEKWFIEGFCRYDFKSESDAQQAIDAITKLLESASK